MRKVLLFAKGANCSFATYSTTFFSFRVSGRGFQSIRVAKGIRAGHCHANPSRVGESDTGPPIGSNHEKGACVELSLA